jgi:pyruvate formate lyase activating enzyme
VVGKEPRAEHWRADEEGHVVCELCPHGCHLAEGRHGLCKVRRNIGGELRLPYYGSIPSAAIDPIEKKPLHHFLPGSSVFSVGFVGCNLHCPYCQNWSISQEIPPELETFSPKSLVEAASRSGTPSIAYTYSEPGVHFEFVRDAMRLARDSGLRNVLVTNGCLNEDPARELLELTDAANVDLKSWSAEGYEKTLGGNKAAVLEFLRIAASLCHLEVTTLVVPGLSDSKEGIQAIADFLASLSPDIPLHLSAYHPAWKHASPPTSPELLSLLRKVAMKKLNYVYLGNIAGPGADTICPRCGATAVSRRGYRIDARGIKKSGSEGLCDRCDFNLHIIV